MSHVLVHMVWACLCMLLVQTTLRDTYIEVVLCTQSLKGHYTTTFSYL